MRFFRAALAMSCFLVASSAWSLVITEEIAVLQSEINGYTVVNFGGISIGYIPAGEYASYGVTNDSAIDVIAFAVSNPDTEFAFVKFQTGDLPPWSAYDLGSDVWDTSACAGDFARDYRLQSRRDLVGWHAADCVR